MLYLAVNKTITSKFAQFCVDGRFFQSNCKREWLDDPWTNHVTTVLDKTPYIGDGGFKSPWLGIIGPEKISGGAATLISMKFVKDTYFPSGWLGDNCYNLLKELSEQQDIYLSLSGNYPIFAEGQSALLVDTNETLDVSRQKYIEYLDNNLLDWKQEFGILIDEDTIEKNWIEWDTTTEEYKKVYDGMKHWNYDVSNMEEPSYA